jgi:hypothetical protein
VRRGLGWAATGAGKAAAAVVVGVLTVAFAFGVPFTVAITITRGAQWTGLLPVEAAATAVLAAATLAAAWWAFAGERVHRWLESGRGAALLPPIGTLGLAIGSFASLTELLYDRGALALHGDAISADTITDRAFVFYLWHLLDAVPLVEIPKTLHWTVPYTYTDGVSGPVLLAFKGFVILPLVQAARLILAGRRR